MNKFDNTDYQKIANAQVDNARFEITFCNGDEVNLDVKSLIPFGIDDYNLSELEVHDYELIIHHEPSDIIIPWDQIRILSDHEFAREMVKKSEENSLAIGVRLKALRERKGIKGADLAQRADVAPQTISRIEKGHTDVGFTTLKRILTAMGSTLGDLANEELDYAESNAELSYRFISQKLGKAGIDSFVHKILPAHVKPIASKQGERLPDLVISEISTYLNRVFDWSKYEIWGNKELVVDTEPAKLAYFKKPSRVNINQIKAYSHYAYYLANVVSNLNTAEATIEYPGDIDEFRSQYFQRYADINLECLVKLIWDMGISVIALNDQGIFHGASWNINQKHVIILKQRSESHARWIFDLLHEVYHVFVHLDQPNTSVVETEEPNPFAGNDSPEELEANAFANEFIFGNTSEDYAVKTLEKAAYRLDYLKRAVKEVAKSEQIRPDFLANYLAFRLQINGQNWWGTANALQVTDPNPFHIVSKILQEKINIQKLNPIDRNLLLTAIN